MSNSSVTLKTRIEQEMKAALLGGNRFRGEVLRNLKAAILNEEVATGTRETGLADSEVEKVIAREVKKRNESATIYEQNMRQDSADEERREAEVLQDFLPEQLSEAELKTIVDAKVAELAAKGDPKKMGIVIGAVKADVGNTADGAMVARLVKDAIQ